MTLLGVNIAIFQGEQIVLTQRDDFEVWCLPGGGVDEGESIVAAAVREAWEETGLHVRLTRLVAWYSRPYWGQQSSHLALFAAEPVGGTLCGQPGEVIDLGFFASDALPSPLAWGMRERIGTAWSGASGMLFSNNIRPPAGWPLTRAEQYAARDRSGLSRQAFYLRYAAQLGPEGSSLELGGVQ